MGKIEREVKIAVECSEAERIRRILERNHIEKREVTERDIYYQHPCRNFLLTDEALRLRISSGGELSLTYKSQRKSTSTIKERLEIIVDIKEGDINSLLKHLGFTPAVIVVKERTYYRLSRDILLSIDHVEGLGCFIEIEGPNRIDIEKIVQKYDIRGRFVEKTYAEMVAEKGLTFSDSDRS